jgi:hypothetical protein
MGIAAVGSLLEFGEGDWITQGDFSPDGRYFVGGALYAETKIWDTTTWEVVATLPPSIAGGGF